MLEIDGAEEAVSGHDCATVYRVGETVRPDSYDDNPLVECTHGIHWFATRRGGGILMASDPDDWAMLRRAGPAAVMLTHLLLLMLGVAMGAILGITFAAWLR